MKRPRTENRVVAELSRRVVRELVTFRVLAAKRGYICERLTIEKDGTRSMQSLPFTRAEEFADWLAGDPYRGPLADELESLKRIVVKRVQG